MLWATGIVAMVLAAGAASKVKFKKKNEVHTPSHTTHTYVSERYRTPWTCLDPIVYLSISLPLFFCM